MGDFKTPLRYPGGKQRLSPFIEDIIVANNINEGHYVEPYSATFEKKSFKHTFERLRLRYLFILAFGNS